MMSLNEITTRFQQHYHVVITLTIDIAIVFPTDAFMMNNNILNQNNTKVTNDKFTA